MIVNDLSQLRCPTCSQPLDMLHGDITSGGVLIEGLAGCIGCSARYPIIHGTIIFLHESEAKHILDFDDYRRFLQLLGTPANDKPRITELALRSALNWTEQLSRRFMVSTEMLEGNGFWGEQSFWRFCGLTQEDVKGRHVCVYCGGSGREAFHLLRAGAARVYVVDIGAHLLHIMQSNQDHAARLIPILADFRENPVIPEAVDISICDHALQHIEDSAGAFAVMTTKTRPGGLVSICVYSYENNFLMTHLVEPLKPLLHRMGQRGLLALALLPAAMLYTVHRVYCMLPRKSARLPFRELLRLWGQDGFTMFHHACFDLLHAPVSHHFRRREIEDMARNNGISIRTLHMVNGTMWTLAGTTPAS